MDDVLESECFDDFALVHPELMQFSYIFDTYPKEVRRRARGARVSVSACDAVRAAGAWHTTRTRQRRRAHVYVRSPRHNDRRHGLFPSLRCSSTQITSPRTATCRRRARAGLRRCRSRRPESGQQSMIRSSCRTPNERRTSWLMRDDARRDATNCAANCARAAAMGLAVVPLHVPSASSWCCLAATNPVWCRPGVVSAVLSAVYHPHAATSTTLQRPHSQSPGSSIFCLASGGHKPH